MNVRVSLPKTQRISISPRAPAADHLDIKFISPETIANSLLKLESLADVVVVDESAGSSLIYNSVTKNFEIKKIDFSIIDGNETDVDGGTF